MSGPRQAISDLRRRPGEISFRASLAGGEREVRFRRRGGGVPPADVALAACLLPAMRAGGSLEVPQPVSPRLLRTQREYQLIQAAWSLEWQGFGEPLREVEVRAPLREVERRRGGRVGAFFSGGVDSWAMVLGEPDLTDLIFVRGLDLDFGSERRGDLADRVEARLREAADGIGLPLHVVETDVRQLSDPIVGWEQYNPSALAASALLFEGELDRVLIASDTDYATQLPLGASMLIDQLWSTERLEIADSGGRLRRTERLRRMADQPLVQRTLRVCWENHESAYNCGRCRKCMITMAALEAFGVRERFETFPAELDLELLAGSTISQPIQLVLWEDLLLATRETDRADLERAVAPVVASGKRALGLPADFSTHPERGPGGYFGALRAAEARGPEAAEAEAARAQLAAALSSRSWQMTRPLRRLGDAIRRRP